MKSLPTVPKASSRWLVYALVVPALLYCTLFLTATPTVAQDTSTGDGTWIWQSPWLHDNPDTFILGIDPKTTFRTFGARMQTTYGL